MYRFGPAFPGGLKQFIDVEVGLFGGIAAERKCSIGHRNVPRRGVGVGIDSHGCDAHCLQRLLYANGYLAAVGYEDS